MGDSCTPQMQMSGFAKVKMPAWTPTIDDHVVIGLATMLALQADVGRAVSRSLELWWRFFDGIATALDAC